MKQALKKSDSIFYLPFCLVSSVLSACVHLFSRAKPRGSRTLIIRPGGLGDLVLLDLAIGELGIPLNECVFIIEKRSEAWAKYRGMDYVCYDRDPIRTFRRVVNQFHTVINTEQLFGLAQTLANIAVTRSGRKLGFSTNRAARYFTDVVPYDPHQEHERFAFDRLLSAAFEKKTSRFIRNSSPVRSSVLWVHIAGTAIPERSLSIEKWTELVAEEFRSDRYEKIIIGSSGEDRAFAEKCRASLEKTLQTSIEVISGEFGILCEKIKTAKRVFTVDSGVVHICSFMNTPVTAVFTSGRSSKWLPLSQNSAILQKSGLSCQPCTLFGQTPPCQNSLACHDLNWNSDRKNLS